MSETNQNTLSQDVSAPEIEYVDNEQFEALQLSGYAGANHSTKRAQIWWPTLDTRRELDTYSRNEMLRRIRALKANGGIFKSFIQNGARLIGCVSPIAVTDDKAWNDLANKSFERRAKSKDLFDVSGKFDFFTAQTMILERALCDGDVLTALTTNQFGGAQFSFYEAHQIQSPSFAKSEMWNDGVFTDAYQKHLRYGILSNDQETSIAARDCIYFGRFESVGHARAHPPLAHAINHSTDITEARADVKAALKVNGLSAVQRTMTEAANPNKQRKSLPGAPSKVVINSETGEAITYEKVFSGGQVQTLAPGEKLEILSDPRPHQNHRDFTDDLIREMALGYGLPPEVIYSMLKLNGPAVRFVMEFAGSWIREWRRHLMSWAHRVWVYFIAKEIKAGRLPVPNDPDWMHAVEFIPSRNLTIDRGRDGRQRLDELDAGCGTWAGWYAEDGKHWKKAIDQRIDEKSYAKEACAKKGLELSEVFPPRQGAAAAPNSEKSPKPKKSKTTEVA